jgi:ubiquinone biosynthesis protein UbiJ
LKLTTDALNHLLHQNTWALEKLRPHAGKTLHIVVPPFSNRLSINGAGEFSSASPETPIDAEIQLHVGVALRLLFQPETASNAAMLQGDLELATTVGKVLQGLRWDAEEDLSSIVGDIPAHQLSQTAGRIRQELSRKAISLAGMVAEYWLEEQPLIAKKHHLEKFSRDVDTLRDDVERITKRLEALEQKR